MLALCFTVLFSEVVAQPSISWNLGTADGLPSSMVYDLRFDENGRLWMGTQNGLVCYDGNEVYRPVPATTNGDRSHVVIRQNGKVWCTDFGTSLYESDRDTIRLKYTFSGNLVTVQEVLDTVYVLTKTELLMFPPNSDIPEVIESFTEGSMWGVGGKTYRLADKIQHRPSGSELEVLREIGSSHVCAVGTDFYRFFFDVGTVLKMNPTHYDTVVVGLHRPNSRPAKLTGVRKTSAGTWIIGYDGAYLLDSNQWFLEGVPVSDLVESVNGAHWFSTLSEGVQVIPSLGAKHISTVQGIRNVQLTRVKLLPSGYVLVCDNNGVLQKVSMEGGEVVQTFEANVSRQGEVIGHDVQRGFTFIGFGDLYSTDRNLQLLSKTDLGNFKKMMITADGNIRTLTQSEIWSIRVKDDGSLNIESREAMPDSCRPVDLLRDTEGNQWLLTSCNLFLNDQRYHEASGAPPKLITISAKGGLWVYAATDSLFRIFRGQEEDETLCIPKRFDSEQPPIKMVANAQHLALLYNHQVLVYTFDDKHWNRFSAADGLPQTDLTDIDISDGMLAISSFNGLYLLPLNRGSFVTDPALDLNSIRINGEKQTGLDSRFELNHDQRDLEFKFAAISPASRGDIDYHFELIGPNGQVEEANRTGSLRLRSLSRGKYELRVFASDAKRNLSPAKQVNFSVLPPWYATTPFIALLVLLGFFGISGIYFLRMRSVRKSLANAEERNQLLENARTSQLTALRAQLNPHFLFNALNSVQGLFSMGMEEKANEAMGLFSRLMRKLLEHSEQENISLAAELEMLRMYLDLESVRFGDDFRFEINLDEQVDCESVMIPPLLVQPYVENAVKHGLLHLTGQKRLHIEVELRSEGVLQITVADNGIGRQAAAKLRKKSHRPFGTKANATRLDLLNSIRKFPITVEVRDGSKLDPEAGTSVIISIPLQDE